MDPERKSSASPAGTKTREEKMEQQKTKRNFTVLMSRKSQKAV